MATQNEELIAYLQSLGLGNTQAPIQMAVPGFAQNFANYQAIPANAQYNPYVVSGDGSPYQQIMARMNSQNYAPSPYGGLLGPATADGGYNTTGGSSLNQAVLDNYQGYSGGGGGDSGGGGGSSGWDSMSNADKAGFYADNPTMAAMTQMGQKGFGYTGFGALQSYFNPNFVAEQNAIAYGINPAYASERNDAALTDALSGLASERNDAAAVDAAYGGGFGVGGVGAGDLSGGYGNAAGYGADGGGCSGGNSSDSDGATGTGGMGGEGGDGPGSGGGSDSGSDSGGGDGGGGGGDGGGGGGDGGGGGWAMGGLIDRVSGRNPPGPDDGTGYLDLGEYVIRKSSVKKYGRGLLDMINEGKVPAKKIKSLLD